MAAVTCEPNLIRPRSASMQFVCKRPTGFELSDRVPGTMPVLGIVSSRRMVLQDFHFSDMGSHIGLRVMVLIAGYTWEG